MKILHFSIVTGMCIVSLVISEMPMSFADCFACPANYNPNAKPDYTPTIFAVIGIVGGAATTITIFVLRKSHVL